MTSPQCPDHPALESAFAKELQELRRARDLFAYRADHDELTGLANRSFFERQAMEAFAAAVPGQVIGLAFIDLDGFKQVNDYYGHHVGDELLVAAAARIGRYVVDSTDIVARISGDEFMMLINPVNSITRVRDLVQEGLAEMREPFQVGGHQLMVSASVGLAFYPDHGASFEELRRNADMAMYRAKRTARGTSVTYEPSMGRAMAERLSQEQALRRAVAERRFRAVVQPKVSLARQRVVGFEVLARQVEDDGAIKPSAAFIDLAEQTGLLDEITDIVIDDALAAMPVLDAAFGADVSISINLSTRQATDPVRLAALVGRLRLAGCAERFIIEVTEDALLELDTFRRDIQPLLGGAGIRVSIDDFGTGFASLSRLLVINADEIKIDRAFITDIHQRPRSQVFLHALGTMGAELGALVVAEGVETESELAYLVANAAVDEVQGFFFGRPMPAADCVAHRDLILARIDRFIGSTPLLSG